MYIMYPEQIQFNIIDEDEEELIGYAERYLGDDDNEYEFRATETLEMKNIKTLLNSIDEEYASRVCEK